MQTCHSKSRLSISEILIVKQERSSKSHRSSHLPHSIPYQKKSPLRELCVTVSMYTKAQHWTGGGATACINIMIRENQWLHHTVSKCKVEKETPSSAELVIHRPMCTVVSVGIL